MLAPPFALVSRMALATFSSYALQFFCALCCSAHLLPLQNLPGAWLRHPFVQFLLCDVDFQYQTGAWTFHPFDLTCAILLALLHWLLSLAVFENTQAYLAMPFYRLPSLSVAAKPLASQVRSPRAAGFSRRSKLGPPLEGYLCL